MGCVVHSALGTGAGGAGLKSSATVPVVIILTVVGCGGGVLVLSTLSTLSTTSDPHYALRTTED